MFRHANGSTDQLKEDFLAMDGNRLDVVLAQTTETIYFTKMHIADLRTVIGVEDREKVEQTAEVETST